jgi:uncharacterized OB-fold protein
MPLWLELICCALFCLLVHEVKDWIMSKYRGKKLMSCRCTECGRDADCGEMLCPRCLTETLCEIKKQEEQEKNE